MFNLNRRVTKLEAIQPQPDRLLDKDFCEQIGLEYGIVTEKEFQGWCKNAMESGRSIHDDIHY